MYDRTNEDVAWQRVKDLQREMENSRRLASNQVPATLAALWRLADWIGTFTWRAGASPARAPRPVPDQAEGSAGNRVA